MPSARAYSLPAVNERRTLCAREVRRATRRTNRLLTGRLSLALIVAACSGLIGAVFVAAPKRPGQILVAGLLGAAVLFALALLTFGYQMLHYRRSGYRDPDWTAHHYDSTPGSLGLTLVHRNRQGAFGIPPVEIAVRAGKRAWVVVPDKDLPPIPRDDTVAYPFSQADTLHPGETYEVRWYIEDRGRFTEITRERFRLRAHQPQQPTPEG
jgi:hypothetical protein